jgi:hypothetical protein
LSGVVNRLEILENHNEKRLEFKSFLKEELLLFFLSKLIIKDKYRKLINIPHFGSVYVLGIEPKDVYVKIKKIESLYLNSL